jgi:hypothetical protein
MKKFEELSEKHLAWISKQRIFFTATASCVRNSRVNVSPKGHNVFRATRNRIFYLDLTGSGAETIAHINENQRLTIMFCAFEGSPEIIRIYCTGRVVLPEDAVFEQLLNTEFVEFKDQMGLRSIIMGDIVSVHSSCGYAVPFYDYKADRGNLLGYWSNKEVGDVIEYQKTKNATSIDGLPSLKPNRLANLFPTSKTVIVSVSCFVAGFLFAKYIKLNMH